MDCILARLSRIFSAFWFVVENELCVGTMPARRALTWRNKESRLRVRELLTTGESEFAGISALPIRTRTQFLHLLGKAAYDLGKTRTFGRRNPFQAEPFFF